MLKKVTKNQIHQEEICAGQNSSDLSAIWGKHFLLKQNDRIFDFSILGNFFS